MAKIFELAFQIGGKLGSSFTGAMRGASGTLANLGKQARALERGGADISRFRALKTEIGDTAKKFGAAQAECKRLGAAIRSTEAPSKGLQKEFQAATRKAGLLKEKLAGQNLELGKIRTNMRAAGIATTNLAASQARLAKEAEKARGAEARLQSTMARIQANRSRRQQMGGAMLSGVGGAVLGGAAIGAATLAPAKMAMDFETSFAGVRKVVSGTDAEIKTLEKSLLRLSVPLNMDPAELAAIAESGGQLGVAAAKIPAFTDTVAKMATAFDMLPEAAGDNMAKLSNVYDVPIEGLSRVGDAVNHLSDNTAAKASDMVNTLTRIGGMSKQFGLNVVQATALSNAFIALGKPPEVAGTAINAMLGKLMTADKQGDKFQKGLKAIGMSAKGLKTAIAQDAQGALNTFLERLSQVDEKQRMGVLMDFFGQEFADDMATVVGSLDKYAAAQKLVANEQDYLGSMTREFQTRNATAAKSLEKIGKIAKIAAINLGSAFLPVIKTVSEKVAVVAMKIADFTERFPTLSAAVIGSVGGLASLAAAGSVLGYVWTWIAGGWLSLVKLFQVGGVALTGLRNGTIALKAAQIAAAVGSKLLAAAQWALNIALNANPIGLIVIGVAALAAGAYLLVRNWETVKTFFSGLWDSLLKVEAVQALVGLLGSMWDGVVARASAAVETIKSIFSGVLQWFSGLNLFESGGKLIGTFIDGIKAKAAAMVDTVKGVFAKVAEYIPHSDAPRGPFSRLTAAGMAIPATIGAGIARMGANPMAAPLARGMAMAGKVLDKGLGGLGQVPGMLPGMAPGHAPVGMGGFGGPASAPKGGAQGAQSMTIHFSPVITVQGEASPGKLDEVLRNSEARLKRMIAQVLTEDRRISYA